MAAIGEERPARKPGVTALSMGDETLLQDTDAHAIHVLNRTAQLIWELCDGEHTVAGIEQSVRAHFGLPPDRDILPDIERTLQAFADKGLLSG